MCVDDGWGLSTPVDAHGRGVVVVIHCWNSGGVFHNQQPLCVKHTVVVVWRLRTFVIVESPCYYVLCYALFGLVHAWVPVLLYDCSVVMCGHPAPFCSVYIVCNRCVSWDATLVNHWGGVISVHACAHCTTHTGPEYVLLCGTACKIVVVVDKDVCGVCLCGLFAAGLVLLPTTLLPLSTPLCVGVGAWIGLL